MEYLFDCEFQGGLIISSKQWFDNFSEELAYSLNVALDVDGKTALRYDYPDQSWNDVWKLEANKWLTLGNSGIAALIVLKEGTYNAAINFNIDLSNSDSLLHFSNLKVEDSDIYIAEAGYFLEMYFSKEEYEDFERIDISSGFYKMYCTLKEDTGSESSFSIFFHFCRKIVC